MALSLNLAVGVAAQAKKTATASKKSAAKSKKKTGETAAAKKTGASKSGAKTTAGRSGGKARRSSTTAGKAGARTGSSKTGSKTASSKSGSRKTASKKGVKSAPVTTWRNRQLSPTPERYKEIQDALAAKGFLSPEEANGQWGQSSVDALKKFQSAQSIAGNGKINSLSLIALGLGPKRDPNAVVQPPEATAK
jgi:hypothetical protein